MTNYVYVYCNPETAPFVTSSGTLPGIPFYVGRGIGDRHLSHLREALGKPTKKQNRRKIAAIRKLMLAGQSPIIHKLVEHLSKEAADNLEITLIAEIGTITKVLSVENRGPLTNLHAGGTGGHIERSAVCNALISKKLKGRKNTWADKISVAKTGIPISEEHAKALHDGGKNRVRTPEENARRGRAIAASFTPETHAKRIAKRRENGWYSEDALRHRVELVESGVLKHTKKSKNKISKAVQTAMADPVVREKMKFSAKKRWANPIEAEKIRERNSRTYELIHRVTNERLIVKNMTAFCRQYGTYHQKVYKEYEVSKL